MNNTPPTMIARFPIKLQARRPAVSQVLSWLALGMALLPLFASSAQAQTSSITRVSSFEYNATGLLTKEVIEPDNAQACLLSTHSYDNFGNKTSVTTSACAGASGSAMASATSPRSASTTYTTDGRFPATTSNALGHSEAKQYDSRFGQPTSLTGPNGLTTTWAYDGFGRKTQESRADGTYSTWTYQYCSEAGANCPVFCFEEDGVNYCRPTSLRAQGAGTTNGPTPIAQTPIWVVTEQNCKAPATAGSGTAANCARLSSDKRQYHDSLNRVIRAETGGFDGSATAAAATLVQDTEYNHLGQIQRKSNTYDQANPASAVWVSYTYDPLGRLIKEEAPDNAATNNGNIAKTTITYNGLSSTITNSQGQSKTTTKDALGRTASVSDHYGNIVSYQYDALGQLISTNAAGNITAIQYNIRGQKIRMDDPAMGVWTYEYNVFGELISQTDSLGQASTLSYDKLGRMISRSEPDLVSTWLYDNCAKGIGKLCQASSNNGYNRTHSYDSLGRPISTSTKLDATVTTSISYEAATGRVASQTYPTGYKASYTYTALGFLKSVTGQGTTGTQAGYTPAAKYDILDVNAQGQITSYKYGNQVTTQKIYNALTGRLHNIIATKDGQATGGIMTHGYVYDSLGNMSRRHDDIFGTQEVFSYDQLNRLSYYQVVGGSVTAQDPSSGVEVRYDARGNISYKSDVGQYWYDPARPNRLTNITLSAPAGAAPLTGKRVLTYAFDDYKPGAKTLGANLGASSGVVMGNGNLWYTVSQDNSNARHTVRWETYTSFNMPKEILFGPLVNSANPTGTVAGRTLTFVYGPEHQRIRQTVQLDGSAPSNMSAGEVWYLNGENNNLSYEKEIKAQTGGGSYTEHKHYLSAGGVVFAMQITRSGSLGSGPSAKPASSLQYLHHDSLGSVAVVTDDTGSVTERMAYDPWGKRRFPNGLADTQDSIVGLTLDRGFTMHEHLDEMGIIHMNGRVFDPLIGRFMSADTVIPNAKFLQAFNRYAYVYNNPLKLYDPDGHEPWSHDSNGNTSQVVNGYNTYTGQYVGINGSSSHPTPSQVPHVNPKDVKPAIPYGLPNNQGINATPYYNDGKSGWMDPNTGATLWGWVKSFLPGVSFLGGASDRWRDGDKFTAAVLGIGAASDVFLTFVTLGGNKVAVTAVREGVEVGTKIMAEHEAAGLAARMAAPKGVLPEAAPKIDSAMIRSLEKGVKEGATSVPIEAGAQLRAVAEAFRANVGEYAATNTERALHIMESNLQAVDRLPRFRVLTEQAINEVKTIIRSGLGP